MALYRDMTFTEATRAAAANADAAFAMDEEAFQGFYDRTSRGVWSYLARMTGDRSLADDLLQEAYYRFLRAGASHESEQHRRNSLYKIATNLALDARRRSLARPTTWIGEEIERAPATAKVDEARTDVSRALGRLKPRERAMLWLAYVEGATHVEIASVLGLSVGGMKQTLFRARRKMADLLGGKEGSK